MKQQKFKDMDSEEQLACLASHAICEVQTSEGICYIAIPLILKGR